MRRLDKTLKSNLSNISWPAICSRDYMILEIAHFTVIPGKELEYEAAISEVYPLIASIEGYVSHELKRCIEEPNKYVFLVYWETLEAHTIGFRESDQYVKWSQRLRPFYSAPPFAVHYDAPTHQKSSV
jgi:heme-degrading monooxygenase HmoA